MVDAANIHIRGTVASLPGQLAGARAVYARQGFTGPLWVTETGYPSDTDHQLDPAFVGGQRAQARWLARGLRTFVDAGAARVFVAFRDTREFGRGSPFSTEGILRWPSARPKLAYWAVRRLAQRGCRC